MAANTPQYYNEVSLRLNGVLDSVGLTEDIRWKRINMWIQSEEIQSEQKLKWHVFGSQAEATTPGLHSDVDCVICRPEMIVKDLESWVPGIQTLLIVSDENTHPGYVKLQEVSKNQPRPVYNRHNVYFKLDRHARSVLCNDSDVSKFRISEHHGPANRNDLGRYITDHVIAMRLHSWPEQSSQWMTRIRRHNWPSQENIGVVLETGALLVPVGHKLSGEKHLEWRLSFSYGEKILVWLFNPTQYKCYILLKMINQCFIKPVVTDDVLSSYHCKTCMFYLIENTPTSMWQQDNLFQCVDLCLRLLYKWIESAICPNYFIPEENMFDCKVYGHVQGQLLDILSNLLQQKCRYLVGISCDNIGQKLMIACQTPIMEFELQCEDVTRILLMSVLFLFVSFFNAVQSFFDIDLMWDQSILDRAFSVRGPRQEVNAILMTFFYSIIGSKLASKILSQESIDQHGLNMAHDYLLRGSSSDVASGKLKLAAFYLAQDNLEMSEDVLNEVHENYSYKILEFTGISNNSIQAILSENLSTTKLISQYTAFPVLYHPSEIKCTPNALTLQMFNSTMSNQGDPYENNLPRMVRVDSKFFLYFLQFICYLRQNKRSHKEAALNNMICTIRQKNLEFIDTDLNLLAYCLMQEGKSRNAYNVLSKSMKLAKRDSSAKWQIAFFVNAAFRFIRRRQ
ncbi:hypothetical protein ACJMK2_011851 [Sinanodonta woodiana]|uniref:Mab-21-like HhH/H2TH-like domain-containing protein n=1 Tax=Sinanodonta woodiana TaxID=1069815 RepID=A0ABD3V7I4_SINWO